MHLCTRSISLRFLRCKEAIINHKIIHLRDFLRQSYLKKIKIDFYFFLLIFNVHYRNVFSRMTAVSRLVDRLQVVRAVNSQIPTYVQREPCPSQLAVATHEYKSPIRMGHERALYHHIYRKHKEIYVRLLKGQQRVHWKKGKKNKFDKVKN